MGIIAAAHCGIITSATPCQSAASPCNSGVAQYGLLPSRRSPQWCSAHCALRARQYKGPAALFAHSSLKSSLGRLVDEGKSNRNGGPFMDWSCCKGASKLLVGLSRSFLLGQGALPGYRSATLGRRIIKKQTLRVRVECEARPSSAIAGEKISSLLVEVQQEEEEELSRGQLLWRAAKLPIYSVAVVPLSVGGATAVWQTGVFNAQRYWLMLCSSILIVTWLNLSNDAYDWETGVDKNKRESVVSISGSQKGVLRAAHACLILGFMGLVLGATQASDSRVAVLLAAAIGCGYVYQCPPFRLSYKGLGEPLCFLAFGPLATTAFYLSQGQATGTVVLPVTLSICGVSLLVGITTTLILFCSHFHQIEGDTVAGKMSPLVRLGTENGSMVVQAAVVGLYSLLAVLTAVKAVPLSCSVLSLSTLPIGKLVLDFVKKNHSNKEQIFLAKYYAVRLHVAFGAAMTFGFFLASRF